MKAADPAIDDESRRITENSRKRKAEKQKQKKERKRARLQKEDQEINK